MNKPYVICMMEDEPDKRFALDRGYQLMPTADMDSCQIKDIVQIDHQVGLAYVKQNWVHELEKEYGEISWVIMWFNYYD